MDNKKKEKKDNSKPTNKEKKDNKEKPNKQKHEDKKDKSNSKPACTVCNKTFSNDWALQQHNQSKHK